MLLALIPLSLPIIIGLRLTGEGEVFYRQRRIGYQNRPFRVWKFATMLKDSPNMLTGSITLRNDPRVTPLGHFLRRSKINELPQVLNVLTGDMSWVGPRPQMQQDFEAYPPHIQAVIYHVRPGITGIGSLVFRDEEGIISRADADPRVFYTDQIAPYKGDLELWYQQHRTFVTDLKILLCTALVIVAPHIDIYRFFRGLPPKPGNLA